MIILAAEGGYQVFELDGDGVVLAHLLRRHRAAGDRRRLLPHARRARRRPGHAEDDRDRDGDPGRRDGLPASASSGRSRSSSSRSRSSCSSRRPRSSSPTAPTVASRASRSRSPGSFRTLAFVAGCVLSGLTGFIGMSLAVRGNVRTAAAAKSGSLPAALKVAFRTGGVAGMFTVGLGLLGATVIIMIFQNTALRDPHRVRLRWLAARAVPAGRRRHLHQGGRRRRRPRGQGRGGHPRGRPPQPGHHRRQRGRQRRRLRRHGRRPVRELRGHARRVDHPRRRRVRVDRR